MHCINSLFSITDMIGKGIGSMCGGGRVGDFRWGWIREVLVVKVIFKKKNVTCVLSRYGQTALVEPQERQDRAFKSLVSSGLLLYSLWPGLSLKQSLSKM